MNGNIRLLRYSSNARFFSERTSINKLADRRG
jgi:hypothetical protein